MISVYKIGMRVVLLAFFLEIFIIYAVKPILRS